MKEILLDMSDTVGVWVASRTRGHWLRGMGQGIGLSEDGVLVAGVTYTAWNGRSLCMDVASNGSRRWLNRKYLWTCFAYPFIQLGCSKVIALVGEGNLQSQAFCEHLGFELEATLSDAHPDGALLVYTMTGEQCRWIRSRLDGKAKSTASS